MEEDILAMLAPLARCHWGIAPQGSVVPFVVLTRVSGGRDYTTDQLSGPTAARVQADIYGATYGETKILARRVIAALSGARHGRITAAFVDSERDLPATDAKGNATQHRTSVDFMIHHID
jgi:hypothetical protein